jgi:NAD(P)-dependent dehydrogenase (short-subunit alcohol dehydrogenase family)
MKVDLKDKVALVTGGANGIGKAIAQVLAQNGARVVIADLDESLSKATAAEIPGAIGVKFNVSDEASVEAGVAFIKANLGKIDILINNAGVNTRNRVNIDQFSNDDWDRIMNVDLRGLFLVSRAVSKLMISQNGGRIVNISSVMGVVPARLQCAFTAAKAGVNQLTRTMAIELAPHNILVNCVAPGSTLTEGTKDLFYGGEKGMSDTTKRMLAHVPLNRPGSTDEMAYAVLYFVAPESGYTTGQILCVDGGWTAGGFFRDF